MNKYLKNLNKIEFVVTNACTGKCKHCSQGEHLSQGEYISPNVAYNAVIKICEKYSIKTVMAFGGEPLLYPDTVYSIMDAAVKMNVPKRQVITNGYFSKDKEKIGEVAHSLFNHGVNDVLLSVDAFHQETIPLEWVKIFAEELKSNNVPTRFQPAWLVSREDNNPYNNKTREILYSLEHLNIPVGEGNIVFPQGNAIKYFGEYFTHNSPINPYDEDPFDVKCVSFSQNGDVLNSNVFFNDIRDILANYTPY